MGRTLPDDDRYESASGTSTSARSRAHSWEEAAWRKLHAADSGRYRCAMGGAMSDLLSDARDLRQRLYRLEVLLQIEKGRRSRTWFTGKELQRTPSERLR